MQALDSARTPRSLHVVTNVARYAAGPHRWRPSWPVNSQSHLAQCCHLAHGRPGVVARGSGLAPESPAPRGDRKRGRFALQDGFEYDHLAVT